MPVQASTAREIVYRFDDFEISHVELGRIIAAARYLGMPASLMLAIGERESRLDVTARPEGMRSTAVGLHQFLKQTWLEIVHDNPRVMGAPEAPDKLERRETTQGTRYHSSDSEWSADILARREDPYYATLAMGLYVLRNREVVKRRTGYRLRMNGEIYIPHLLGPNGGSRLIETALKTPDRRSDHVFSRSVLQNRGVFFEGDRNRTVREVVIHLIKDMEQRRKKYVHAERMFNFYNKDHIMSASQ